MVTLCARPREVRAGLCSILLHGAAIGAVILLTAAPDAVRRTIVSSVPLFAPAPERPVPRIELPDGGGGDLSPLPVSQGRLPRFSDRQFVPPANRPDGHKAVIEMEPTLLGSADLNLASVNLPDYGDPNAPPGPPSNGRGLNGGMGDGKNGGVGDGVGPRYNGGGTPGRAALGGVSPPAAIYTIEPDYSDDARHAHLQGQVILNIEVDERGRPRNIRVMHSLGLGLDEKAQEAVGRWRFRPATRDGRPIAASATVYVNFRLL